VIISKIILVKSFSSDNINSSNILHI